MSKYHALVGVDAITPAGLARDVVVTWDEQGIITAIEPRQQWQAQSRGAETEVIDGLGRLAAPGLVNAHCHAVMVPERGVGDGLPLFEWLEAVWSIEKRLRLEDMVMANRLAYAEMIASGITTVIDTYMYNDTLLETFAASGMKGALSTTLVERSDALFTPDAISGRVPQTPEEALDMATRWDGAAGGRIRMQVSVHAVYSGGDAFLRRAIADAQRVNLPFHIHLSETAREVRECRARSGGLSPIELVQSLGGFESDVLAVHCVHLDDQDIAILAASERTSVVHCPGSNLRLGSGIAPVARLARAGVRICIGTDGPASNDTLSMLREMYVATVLQRGATMDPTAVTAKQALGFATQNGAIAAGHARSGAILIGRTADIVLYDRSALHWFPVDDPIVGLALCARESDVRQVFVDGRQIYRDGKHLTLDVTEAKAYVQDRLDHLRKAS